jgi:hypothetical protein
MNRICVNVVNHFCFVCGIVFFLKNKRKLLTHLKAELLQKTILCRRQPFPTKSHGNLTIIFLLFFRLSFLQFPELFYDLEAIGLQVFYS